MSAQVVNPASREHRVSRPRMANMARVREAWSPKSSTTALHYVVARPVARASSISASVASELLQALSSDGAQTRVYNMIFIVVLFLTWRRQGRRRARCGGIQAVCRKNRTGCQAILTQAFPGVCCGVPLQGCRAIFPACRAAVYTACCRYATAVKWSVVGYHGQPFEPFLPLCPYGAERGSVPSIVVAKAVHTGAEIFIIVRFGTDEGVTAVAHDAVAHLHCAYGAHTLEGCSLAVSTSIAMKSFIAGDWRANRAHAPSASAGWKWLRISPLWRRCRTIRRAARFRRREGACAGFSPRSARNNILPLLLLAPATNNTTSLPRAKRRRRSMRFDTWRQIVSK